MRSIQEGLSINNSSCHGEANDGTACSTKDTSTGLRWRGQETEPRHLTRTTVGGGSPPTPESHRSHAQAAHTDSVSPQEPRQSQIMAVPYNAWPMSVLCLRVIHFGFVAQKLKATRSYESSNVMTLTVGAHTGKMPPPTHCGHLGPRGKAQQLHGGGP